MADENCDSFGLSDNERMDLSQHSQACGIRDCGVPPEQLCRKCNFWYCTNHDKLHYKRFPDHLKKEVL